MHMNGACAIQLQNRCEFVRRHRAQRVRSKPEDRALLAGNGPSAGRHQLRKSIYGVDETPLVLLGCTTAETRMSIEHRQQRESDTGGLRRRYNALRQFADVGIMCARRVVMNIMKLADAGESGLQHFNVGLCRDRLNIVGGHAANKAVHHFAPGPETVRRAAPDFREPRHATLERMTVQIGHAGKPDPVMFITRIRRGFRFDAGESAILHRQPDVTCPALRQQRFIKEQSGHALLPIPREALDSFGRL